jgi:hypothetical protein
MKTQWADSGQARSLSAYGRRASDALLGKGSPNVYCFLGWHRWVYWPENTSHCEECGKEQTRTMAR